MMVFLKEFFEKKMILKKKSEKNHVKLEQKAMVHHRKYRLFDQ